MRHEIKALTGFRGAAAMVVAIYHFGHAPGEPHTAGRFALPKGYLAVDAFFILSAFVLSYTYGAVLLQALSVRTWWEFFVRRLARLYPAYYGVLALTIAKVVLTDPRFVTDLSVGDWVVNLAMATGWGLDVRALVGTSWSASTELVCYVAFPWALRAARSGGAVTGVVALVLAVAGLAVYAALVQGVNGALDLPSSADGLFPLLRAACGFTIGLVVFHLYEHGSVRRAAAPDVAFIGAGAVLAVALALDSDLLAVLALAGMIFALALEGRLAQGLFANRVALYLGHISYSLYLVHPVLAGTFFRLQPRVAGLVGPAAANAAWFALYLVTSLGIASLLFRVFEIGGKRLVLGLFGRPARS